MQIPQPSNDHWSQRVLDWLKWTSAAAAIITPLVTAFAPSSPVQASRASYWIAGCLAVISVITFFARRKQSQPQVVPTCEDSTASSLLRSTQPFENGDKLPCRETALKDLLTLVAASDFQLGIICGETGSGKTSLLRAGLIPALTAKGQVPLYIPQLGKEPGRQILTAIQELSVELGIDLDDGECEDSLAVIAENSRRHIVIICDQFDDLVLSSHWSEIRDSFVRWVRRNLDCKRIRFLFSVRNEALVRMRDFAPEVIDPTSNRRIFELPNFTVDEAQRFLVLASKNDGVAFDSACIDAVVDDLANDGLARPIELQIVASRLKRERIGTLRAYEIAGRAHSLLTTYVSEIINHSPSPTLARLVLRQLCPPTGNTRFPIGFTVADVEIGLNLPTAVEADRPTVSVSTILEALVQETLVTRTENYRYNLCHNYVIPYVRAATIGAETARERAERWLRYYVEEYVENHKSRIPSVAMKQISRNASRSSQSREPAATLIDLSRRAHLIDVLQGILAGMVLTGIAVGLTSFVYQSVIAKQKGPIAGWGYNPRSGEFDLALDIGRLKEFSDHQIVAVIRRTSSDDEPLSVIRQDKNVDIFPCDPTLMKANKHLQLERAYTCSCVKQCVNIGDSVECRLYLLPKALPVGRSIALAHNVADIEAMGGRFLEGGACLASIDETDPEDLGWIYNRLKTQEKKKFRDVTHLTEVKMNTLKLSP